MPKILIVGPYRIVEFFSLAMSEFKFACPVCGQHITADSRAAGSQLACPTCFRKIVVPQGPGSADHKFILSAAEVNKPRPIPTETTASATGQHRRWNPILIGAGALVVLLGSAAVAFFVVRAKQSSAHNHETKPNAQVEQVWPTPTNTLPWSLDLADMKIPAQPASGRIHGRDFVFERATIQGGNLTLRHGRSGPVDLGLSIYFFTDDPEDVAGKLLTVTTNNTRSPRVVLRWKDGDKAATQTIKGGYAMKLDFGPIASNRLNGQIYICLPDDSKSCVAGAFQAEIRKPTPPKPRASSTPTELMAFAE